MALVSSFSRAVPQRTRPHDRVEATYMAFSSEGRRYVQIDTLGRPTREIVGGKSQKVQFDRDGAEALVAILRREFNLG